MISYLPYIFGLSCFLGGLYLFLFSVRIYKPKHKTTEQRERYEKSLEKFGALMKVCSVILILNGSYDLIRRDNDRYRVGNGDLQWTAEHKAIFIKSCIRDAGPNYPQINRKYCNCAMDKIMKAMTREQYENSLSRPQPEQIREILPIIQGCVDELKQRIDSVNRQTK